MSDLYVDRLFTLSSDDKYINIPENNDINIKNRQINFIIGNNSENNNIVNYLIKKNILKITIIN